MSFGGEVHFLGISSTIVLDNYAKELEVSWRGDGQRAFQKEKVFFHI
jgi:hypothetical protein